MARKPVVFIPGFPGTGLHDANWNRDIFPPSLNDLLVKDRKSYVLQRLQGPEIPEWDDAVTTNGVIRGVSMLGFEVSKEADTLYQILGKLGYRVGHDMVPVAWDWRRPVYSPMVVGRALIAIEELAARSGESVVVIVHSTGGLVLRALLELSPPDVVRRLAGSIDQVVSLGVPWVGTLKTLRYIGIGQKEPAFSTEEMRAVLGHAWAAFDLMPPDPARTDMTDEAGEPINLFVDANGRQIGPLVEKGWMKGNADFIRRADASNEKLGARSRTFRLPDGVEPIRVTNVAGWGQAMDTTFVLDGTEIRAAPATEEGDATVPLKSAAWLRGPGVRTLQVPVGLTSGFIPEYHSQIWDTPSVKEILQQALTGMPSAPVVTAALDYDDVVNQKKTVVVRVVAFDENGEPLPNATARFAPRAGMGSRRTPLVNGRASLRYTRGTTPTGGRYLVPVTVEWEEAGQAQEQTIELYFFA